MGRTAQWVTLRRNILALRDAVRGGECRASSRENIISKGTRKWAFAMQLKAGGNWRPREVKGCDWEWGRHNFTTSPDLRSQEADASIKRVPVSVGAELQICLAGSDTDVDVVTGVSLEEIVLEARWKAGYTAGDWSDFQLVESPHYVKLQRLGGHGGPALEGSVSLDAIRAAMPARWCSLFVEGNQKSVRIQSLKEGTLNVETSGGHVTLGDMRGGSAKILTNGGRFTADMVSADSVIKTSGGNVAIKGLVGTTIDVDTNGGDINIGSLYGNHVMMKSSGGSFEAKHMQAQEKALVSTEGGSVHITGIDGKATIVTRGGDVSLQLHEHAREIDIDASNGSVTLYFSNSLSAQVEYTGVTAIEQASQILHATAEPGQYSFTGSEFWGGMYGDGSRASRSEEASQASADSHVCKIKIISSGSLHVKMRSWIDVARVSSLPSFLT